MDVSAVVLNKLLTERNLETYSKLKLIFLDSAYSTLYIIISKHYEKYGELPSFQDLELTLREGQAAKTLASLKLLEIPDVSSDLALDALIDQYTQSETIKLLERFIPKLPLYSSEEIKEELSSIAMTMEEKTHTSENVFNMQDMMLFQRQEDTDRDRVYLGLNNAFDAAIGGMTIEELLLIGGKRGAGKSIVCSNLFVNQYVLGNSCQYFSIEMKAIEVHQRNMAILAGVNYQSIKQNKLTHDEVLKLVKVRANMFVDADGAVSEFIKHSDRYKFEEDLTRNYSLKPDNQMIIVDDRNLSLASIDMHLGKAKARFGDKFKLAVIDYLNQIVTPGVSQYEWIPQIEIAKGLKNLGRKHGIVIVSPYQIDDGGEARFAKGILDSADIACILHAHEKDKGAISFETTKIRSAADVQFTSPIDWDTVTIFPQSIEKPEKQDKSKKSKAKTETPLATGEPDVDLPWNE